MDKITLTPSQQTVFSSLKKFLKGGDRVFILGGYAGTGKTTLMRFLVEHLNGQKIPYTLLASTGRAASVLSRITRIAESDTAFVRASTIHSMIYSYKGFNQDISEVGISMDTVTGQLFLVFESVSADENDKQHVYIIDESSMISDMESKNIIQARFGSGRLLKELLEYNPSPQAKYIFVGDPCQLPPVDQPFSPALSPEYIKAEFGERVCGGLLTEIMRQEGDNSIVETSRRIRSLYDMAPMDDTCYGGRRVWGKLPIYDSDDIVIHATHDDFDGCYVSNIQRHGYSHSIYICRGNMACFKKSMAFREALGMRGSVCKGDLLQVIQNNIDTTLCNGDMVEVVEVKPHTEVRAGLTFVRVEVKEITTGQCYSALLIEDVLHSGTLNLNSEQQKNLFVDFIIRMKKMGLTQKKNKAQFEDAMLHDPYLNALRCVFGYAVTCHKSQGGEWTEVFVDLPRNITLNPVKASYQWVYTAITRATDKLHLVRDFYLA